MVIYSLSGTNGQLYIYENHLEIHRKGLLAHLTHLKSGDIVIPFNEITKVKMYPGTFLHSGYFYFKRSNSTKSCNLIDAARDNDCIVFRFYENKNAKTIKKYINEKI